MAPIVLPLDEKGAASLGQGIRLLTGLRWLYRSMAVAIAVGGAIAIAATDPQDRPSPLVVVVLLAFGIGILAITESVTRPERAVAALDPAGTITLDELGVRFHQPVVLAQDAFIPWANVTGVMVDESRWWRFGYEVEGRRRFLLAHPESGLNPAHRPPLLSTAPVRPNVLFLIDPPVEMQWAHPQPQAVVFSAPRGGAPARPWGHSGSTPAVWARVTNAGEVAKSAEALARLRLLTSVDVHRLRYELGDLRGPNPYRARKPGSVTPEI